VTVDVTPEGSGTLKINGIPYNSFPAYRTVEDNSNVSFEAIPTDGYEFANWSGEFSRNENPTTYFVTCDITVIANFQEANDPPVANAGEDQTVDEGTTVTLDGSASDDPDGQIASYLWTQTAGTSVTLSDSSAVQPTFTAPNVDEDGEALTFQLTVTDNGGLQDSDTCIVNVTSANQPPTADAGPDQTVDEGVTVTLDGSNSSDPDDGIASYLWTQTTGTSVTLSDSSAVQPTFTAPNVDEDGEALTFKVTVTDNGGLQSSDTCIVNVTNVGGDDSGDNDGGGGGDGGCFITTAARE
jgi:hypothetical protein